MIARHHRLPSVIAAAQLNNAHFFERLLRTEKYRGKLRFCRGVKNLRNLTRHLSAVRRYLSAIKGRWRIPMKVRANPKQPS